MNDDWRIRIEVEEEERASGFLERLTGNLGSEPSSRHGAWRSCTNAKYFVH